MPLGCNVIRRDLGLDAITQISLILKASIEHSLIHRQEAVEYARQFGQDLDLNLTNEFIGMYVNDWTLDYSPVGRLAVSELLKRGYAAGFVPPVNELEFI
jgi:1,4-dihydroxy-6-naphthoate synthase